MLNESQVKKLAHDLRNELSSIYTYSQILTASFSPDDHKELKIAQAIEKSIQHMNALISERMDVA